MREFENVIAAVAARVGPTVVGLGQGWGRGCGVVVGQGQVLASARDISGEEVRVSTADGRALEGSVAGVDRGADLAAIEVETGDVEPVSWRPDEVTPRIGQAVVALGNPGGRGLSVTFGTICGSRSLRLGGRRLEGGIEHTAPLPRGSSGGPLVDVEGRLLGLNALRVDGGLILALPADATMATRAAALWRGEAPRDRRLGVALAPPRAGRRMRKAVGLPERDGLLVRGVQDGGPAERAGLRQGDLVIAAAGRSVATVGDLEAVLHAPDADDTLALAVLRGVEERTLVVDLTDAEVR